MEFSHPGAPERRAIVEEQPPAVVLRWDDGSGKRRKKTFRKKALGAARMAALRFLFAEGFALCAPQDGPMRWLTRTAEQYPHGHPFALGADGIWCADTGAVRRVARGSCVETAWPLGEQVMARSVGYGGGRPVVVFDTRVGGLAQGAPFPRGARDRLAYGVIAIGAAGIEPLFEVPYAVGGQVVDRVSVARDGRFVGPAQAGAGLYDGATCVETWPVVKAQYYAPRAAISPNGEWVALMAADGAIRIEGPTSRVVAAGFEQVLRLEIDDRGVAWAGALGADFWGTYRLDTTAERICEATDATPAPDGESVVAVRYGGVERVSLSGDVTRRIELPWLGMAKTGRARFIDAATVIVRTDAHTLAEIDLGA